MTAKPLRIGMIGLDARGDRVALWRSRVSRTGSFFYESKRNE